jgi:hypothetical protein
LQLRVALEELLARTQRFELAGEIVATRCPEVGARSVPLRLVARRRSRARASSGPSWSVSWT